MVKLASGIFCRRLRCLRRPRSCAGAACECTPTLVWRRRQKPSLSSVRLNWSGIAECQLSLWLLILACPPIRCFACYPLSFGLLNHTCYPRSNARRGKSSIGSPLALGCKRAYRTGPARLSDQQGRFACVPRSRSALLYSRLSVSPAPPFDPKQTLVSAGARRRKLRAAGGCVVRNFVGAGAFVPPNLFPEMKTCTHSSSKTII